MFSYYNVQILLSTDLPGNKIFETSVTTEWLRAIEALKDVPEAELQWFAGQGKVIKLPYLTYRDDTVIVMFFETLNDII
ncbi:hypothetical protein LJ707_02610 [Mucilaginibacter sp. UR6-1]|uniref:hypothetical protein n=1 Tax=Mucilaginibacter sp. UR6-1 TaxID=1435643 RepID=UPI001E4183C5|nr:hypothetical protein [Mucilaginibacter sp. UR6-1]MCC8407805.1 hypothetical protein [Mucilaginibacter sp. UR6-1]